MKKQVRVLAAVSAMTLVGGASVFAQYGGNGGMQDGSTAGSGMQQEPAAGGMDSAGQMGSPMDSTGQVGSAGQLSSDEVRQVQQSLADAGHDVGPIDGIWGPRTADALRSFQQSQGMVATGEIDAETLSALGIDTSEFAAGEFERPGDESGGAMDGDVQQQPEQDQGAGEGQRSGGGLF